MLGTRKGHRRPVSGRVQILSDPDVRRWYDDAQRGSRATGDVYLRRLAAFCGRVGRTPAEIAGLDESAAHRLLLDFVSAEERRGATGSFVSHTITVARSWLTFNGRPVVRRIKIRRADATPTLDNERTPTQEELRRILLAAPPQWRTATALVAHAGLRLGVLGSYLGDDGLTVRDLPDLVVEKGELGFARVPAMVVVRPELSKAGHRYFSFLTAEAAGYVRDYLVARQQAGETIGPDTDIVHPARAHKRFVRTINIGDGIRAAIRVAGFPWRPYVLRAYADTQMLLTESKGHLARDYRVFFMGHKGSMEARYTTNKGRLPAHVIDDMREAYRRCEPLLSTVPTGNDTAERTVAVLRALLRVVGYTDAQLGAMDLGAMTAEQVNELIDKRPTAPAVPAPGPKAAAPGQLVIGEEELGRYLRDGWRYVAPVNGSKFVVERAG